MDDLFINIAPSKPSGSAASKSSGDKVKGGRWTDRCVALSSHAPRPELPLAAPRLTNPLVPGPPS